MNAQSKKLLRLHKLNQSWFSKGVIVKYFYGDRNQPRIMITAVNTATGITTDDIPEAIHFLKDLGDSKVTFDASLAVHAEPYALMTREYDNWTKALKEGRRIRDAIGTGTVQLMFSLVRDNIKARHYIPKILLCVVKGGMHFAVYATKEGRKVRLSLRVHDSAFPDYRVCHPSKVRGVLPELLLQLLLRKTEELSDLDKSIREIIKEVRVAD